MNPLRRLDSWLRGKLACMWFDRHDMQFLCTGRLATVDLDAYEVHVCKRCWHREIRPIEATTDTKEIPS